MPNTLATPTWVTKEVARGYVNNLTFLSNVNRTYDKSYIQAGAKVGYTVQARLPQRWQATDGQALQLQSIYDQTVPITLTNQKNVAWGYSTAAQTMEIQEVKSRYAVPGGKTLANAAEVLAFGAVYRDIYSAVGVPGTTPTSTLTYLQAGTKLTDLSTDLDGRVACLDPLAMQTLANNAATLFNPSQFVSNSTKKGRFSGALLGVDEWYQDPVTPTHTTGSFTASTPVINGASQTGSTLATNGWASGASTLNKGDVFTVAGVNSVNPLSYSSNGRLQQFVVTATTSDSAGAMATLPISPSIITSGQLQTVDASPASGAAITVWNANPSGGALTATTSKQSFVYHPDAFAFVMADLEEPGGGAMSKFQRSEELGFSIRWVQQYQIGTDQNPSRLDILIGAATLQARLAARVVG